MIKTLFVLDLYCTVAAVQHFRFSADAAPENGQIGKDKC